MESRKEITLQPIAETFWAAEIVAPSSGVWGA
jgi:hypothetical protein